MHIVCNSQDMILIKHKFRKKNPEIFNENIVNGVL